MLELLPKRWKFNIKQSIKRAPGESKTSCGYYYCRSRVVVEIYR